MAAKYSTEAFYRAQIREQILNTTLPPFDLKVSKIPAQTSGFLTISPNTENEEIIQYGSVNGTSLTINVTKRGIKWDSTDVTTDGAGAATGDYNNSTYMKPHSSRDSIRGDINHLHINQLEDYFRLSDNETTTWNNTHSWDNIFTKSIRFPVYANDAARNAGIPSPSNGMVVYNTAAGVHQQYIGWAWTTFASGTTVNADTTTSGKVELSTTAEMYGGDSTWGSGAGLVISPSQLQSYYSFGDGSDGNVTISSNTTLTRDMYYNNLTINSGFTLNPDGYAIYARWTITFVGTWKIARNGNNGSNASGSNWGNGWAALTTWTCWPNLWGATWATWGIWAGAQWGNWVAVAVSYIAGGSASASWGAGGGNPWNGWPAGTNATVTSRWTYYNQFNTLAKSLGLIGSFGRAIMPTSAYWAMPSSGAWGAWAGNGPATAWGGGGGSGGNWWIIYVYARNISWAWTIEAIGWTWGNWAQSANANCGWGGGGGGGNGWVIVLVYSTWTVPTMTVSGWTWGSWWAANGWSSVAGSAGGTGAAWVAITIVV